MLLGGNSARKRGRETKHTTGDDDDDEQEDDTGDNLPGRKEGIYTRSSLAVGAARVGSAEQQFVVGTSH